MRWRRTPLPLSTGISAQFQNLPSDRACCSLEPTTASFKFTDDEGAAWRKADLPGLPEHIYVQRLLTSQHDENVAYAALDNHQNGDFKPYLMKTADRGKTWINISAGCLKMDP